MLVTITLFASSCGKSENINNNPQDAAGETTLETEKPTEAPGRFSRVDVNLPEKDFEGYNFNVLAWYVGLWEGAGGNDGKDIWVEEEIGEALNDAVYYRNKIIEEKYNININLIRMDIGDINSAVKNTVTAGDNAYDLVYQRLHEVGGLIQAGYFADLYGIPHVDFENPWWDEHSVEQQSLSGKAFIAASDIITTDKNSVSCVLFNKQLTQDYAIENLYDVVKRGDWTLDYLMEICKNKAKDLNGDGVIDDKDFIPIDSEDLATTILFNGAGSTFALKDENDLPYPSFLSPRNLDVCNKILDIMYDPELYVNLYGGLFEKDRSIFFIHQVQDVIKLRNMETDFGVLPVPKYDKTQKEYYNCISIHQSGLVSIPTTAPDTERTGIILEALSAESRFTVMPAYYDLALKGKYLRDDESEDMLDILFNGRIYDIGGLYHFGGFPDKWLRIYATKSRDLVSMYEKSENTIQKDIDKLIDNIQKLD
jgi:hypothetical protein